MLSVGHVPYRIDTLSEQPAARVLSGWCRRGEAHAARCGGRTGVESATGRSSDRRAACCPEFTRRPTQMMAANVRTSDLHRWRRSATVGECPTRWPRHPVRRVQTCTNRTAPTAGQGVPAGRIPDCSPSTPNASHPTGWADRTCMPADRVYRGRPWNDLGRPRGHPRSPASPATASARYLTTAGESTGHAARVPQGAAPGDCRSSGTGARRAPHAAPTLRRRRPHHHRSARTIRSGTALAAHSPKSTPDDHNGARPLPGDRGRWFVLVMQALG
jgi:hypothetical protein